MKIGTAYAAKRYFNLDLVVPADRLVDVHDVDVTLAWSVFYQCFHRFSLCVGSPVRTRTPHSRVRAFLGSSSTSPTTSRASDRLIFISLPSVPLWCIPLSP